jgi:hypothetical protein
MAPERFDSFGSGGPVELKLGLVVFIVSFDSSAKFEAFGSFRSFAFEFIVLPAPSTK